LSITLTCLNSDLVTVGVVTVRMVNVWEVTVSPEIDMFSELTSLSTKVVSMCSRAKSLLAMLHAIHVPS
jgi:hypothetical protein